MLLGLDYCKLFQLIATSEQLLMHPYQKINNYKETIKESLKLYYILSNYKDSLSLNN